MPRSTSRVTLLDDVSSNIYYIDVYQHLFPKRHRYNDGDSTQTNGTWSKIAGKMLQAQRSWRVSGVEEWGMCILTERFCAVAVMTDMRYEIGVRTWSANMRADHFLVFGRTIAGRKRGRRFKAAGANETQRVRAGCFVRGRGWDDCDGGPRIADES